ncbi:MAG: hypothetical protein JSS98_11405 [Bacteroidetes bacterium]|nr:hypothetical protein [Bacteroidota bacterium]
MEKQNVIYTLLFASLLLVLLLCFLLFFFVHYRNRRNRHINEIGHMKKHFDEALLQSQIEVQEATYNTLAKELHDNVGQLLSSSKMLLGLLQRQYSQPPETLNIAEETIGKAITELRALSQSLDKDWLEQFDLIENLNNEIKRIHCGDVLSIQLVHEGNIPLSSDQQIILFRIIQEGIQNILKHAEGHQIIINIKKGLTQLCINILDDGKGFTPHSSRGLGMRNMQKRTQILGGTIEWMHLPSGSEIAIQIPIKK